MCQVTSVIGEGKQRRYEIRDTDTEADPRPYRASLQQMTPIPSNAGSLIDLKPKCNVLALYPGTTTFYKAEVVLGKKKEGEGPPPGFLRLRFEGEDEADRFEDVERRYVLSEWAGKYLPAPAMFPSLTYHASSFYSYALGIMTRQCLL